MLVLDAAILRARRNRDFGRVEADIALIVKPGPNRPVQRLTVFTSQPASGARPLRRRLIEDAARLVRLGLLRRPTLQPLAA